MKYLNLFILSLMLVSFFSCSKDESAKIDVSVEKILFTKESLSSQFIVNANIDWTISLSNIESGFEVTPMKGSSGATNVQIKATINRPDKLLSSDLIVRGGGKEKIISVSQEAFINTQPTKPVIESVTSITSNVGATSTIPVVKWKPSTDEDGDKLYYYVEYSENNEDWTILPKTEDTQISFIDNGVVLKANTKYSLRVVCDDENNSGRVVSEKFDIVTGNKDCYSDGDYKVYKEGTVKNPVKIIFVGDGYLPKHFVYGGLFEQDIKSAVDGLFSVEPYKTYKDYFTIYAVSAFSKEEGISKVGKGNDNEEIYIEKKDTYFESALTGGTGIRSNYNKIYERVCNIPGITDENLPKYPISLIINADTYAGTCNINTQTWKTICMTTVMRESARPGSEFFNVFLHEFGGHGFGRLADEYVEYSGNLPIDGVNALKWWQENGYHLNLSVESEMSKSPWSNFVGVEGYNEVGMHPGGYYFESGVYRSEKLSCMGNTMAYFNAQSRFLIFKRIMETAKEDSSFATFLKNDKKDKPAAAMLSSYANFVPLAPPIMDNSK